MPKPMQFPLPLPLHVISRTAFALGCVACWAFGSSGAVQAKAQGEPERAEGSVSQGDTDPKWELVWSDEFDGETIDDSKWNREVDCWGGGNEERQCYTDSAENAYVRDGKLFITAIKKNTTGPAFPPHLRKDLASRDARASKPYSSARLNTEHKGNWRFGRIEVRAKLPQGQGTWPAIWMLPQNDLYGTWAASGEIDILEAVNLGVTDCKDCEPGGENTILGTLHFGGEWPKNKHSSTEISYPPVLDGFHDYAIEWRRGEIAWFVDGKEYARKTAKDWFTTGSDNPNAPFDQRFYLILNVAIGGNLAESRGTKGVDKNGFPKAMEVDWVRVYECKSHEKTGESCNL